MSSIIIKESQLVKLLETAMDLDIYVQPIEPMKPGQNDNVIDALEEIKDRAEEIVMMAEKGIEIGKDVKREIFKLSDLFKKSYEKVKFIDKSDIVPML